MTPTVKPVHRLAAKNAVYRATRGEEMGERDEDFIIGVVSKLLSEGRCVMLHRKENRIDIRVARMPKK